MILLQASHIRKSYGSVNILTDITLTVNSGEKIGMVGINGAGKSTLLKIMAGQLSADEGNIIKAKDVTLGYLAQDSGLNSANTIYTELISVFQTLLNMEEKLRLLEKEISEKALLNLPEAYQKLLKNYAELSETFKNQEGYNIHSKTRSVINGLNLDQLGENTPINTLSGGQKTLVALAKLLLQSPPLLMLDEPTNYLDISTLDWLEQYLKTYAGSILVVSHDRYLLESLTNVIYEIENGKSKRYPGNYSAFLEQKAEYISLQLKEYHKQQEETTKLREFFQRNIARASTSKRAKSKMHALEKIEPLDKPDTEKKKVSFQFNIETESGKEVLQLKELNIGYPNKELAKNVTFLLEKGESLALLGPNGMGKSTLLKTIIGKVLPLSGDFKLGAKVTIGYYEQEQAHFTSEKSVLNELWDDFPQVNEKDIRNVLGNFLFSGDNVQKPVTALSGGEKARLALAKILLLNANFLILDEPTNHLDLFSREILENALVDYPGTILIVSHDRYFVNKIATRIIELQPQGIVNYVGDYDYYLLKKQESKEKSPINDSRLITTAEKQQKDKENYLVNKEAQKSARKKQRRLEELEKLISQYETTISQWEADLCLPEVFSDYAKCDELNIKLSEAKTTLNNLMNEWILLGEEIN